MTGVCRFDAAHEKAAAPVWRGGSVRRDQAFCQESSPSVEALECFQVTFS